MSDKEIAEFISSFGEECVCCPLDKTCDGACVARITKWLSEPHETTADEDREELHFMPSDRDEDMVEYQDANQNRVRIRKSQLAIDNKGWVTDAMFDKICTIAEKKRKELGWK